MTIPESKPPFGFIYQDESGEAKRQQKFFVVGLLRVRDRCALWDVINKVRYREKFWDEMPSRGFSFIMVFIDKPDANVGTF